ncbi:MAG: YdbH domain-containing protein [Alphaproteobacteria bacterium]|nr:YdbH domain-containing protein [Alphaproteobacteria bacterium]
MNYDPNDLLSQISAQDEIASESPKKKKHRSISIDLAVFFMKLTFAFDEIKRKYSFLFSFLGGVWAVFMGLVYLGGFLMVGLLVHSYASFPDKVRETLVAQGIITKGYDVESMSLSKVELKNLEDKDGTYSIKKMVIHSTFADFIRGRVKTVELDGVKIKVTKEKDGINLGKLPEALITLNQNPALSKIRVNDLQVNNAELEFNGSNFSIPVSFNLTGVYSRETKITMTLFTRKEHVKIDGVLSITGNAQKMDFTLKINNGTLELPQRTPENISGEIVVQTQKMQPMKINGHLSLSYGKNLKEFDLSMNKSKDGFSGNMSVLFSQGNQNSQNAQSHINVDFSDVQFETLYRFKTKKSLKVKMKSFKVPQIELNNLTASLNGELVCDHLNCTYQVQATSPVFVKGINTMFAGDVIKSTSEFNFSLASNNKTSFTYNNNALNYDLKIGNLSFSGYRNISSSPISLFAGTMSAVGSYHFVDKSANMMIDAKKVNISTPEVDLTNATFKNDNIFNDNSKISLSSDRTKILQNDILRAPFKLFLEKTGKWTTQANIIIDNVINVSFAGETRLLTGELNGNLYVKEFDLSAVKTPLNEISSLFVDKVTGLTGHAAVVGRIYLKNSKQISGPMFVSLKNVGFSRDNIKVSGLNTVLSLQTLAPLVSAVNQKVFIAEIDGIIPLQNIVADIKFDNQFLRLSSAQLNLAGITLTADTAMLPLKATSSLLNFKNNIVDFAQMTPYLNASGADFTGKGSVQLSLELKDGRIWIKDGELKVLNAEVLLSNADNTLKKYFENAQAYAIRSGNVFMDSNSEDTTVNLNLSLDGRIQPMSKMKNVREQLNQNLSDLIKPVSKMAVPEDIVRRQEIVAH